MFIQASIWTAVQLDDEWIIKEGWHVDFHSFCLLHHSQIFTGGKTCCCIKTGRYNPWGPLKNLWSLTQIFKWFLMLYLLVYFNSSMLRWLVLFCFRISHFYFKGWTCKFTVQLTNSQIFAVSLLFSKTQNWLNSYIDHISSYNIVYLRNHPPPCTLLRKILAKIRQDTEKT